VSDAGRTTKTKPADAALMRALERDWKTVAGFLRDHPQFILEDTTCWPNWACAGNSTTSSSSDRRPWRDSPRPRPAKAPPARSWKHRDGQLRRPGADPRAVVDLLEARNHADLARRLDEVAQLRFGLLGAVIALEGPSACRPAGVIWRPGTATRC
jgi:hypothetical protein